jgi:hypothetical protein
MVALGLSVHHFGLKLVKDLLDCPGLGSSGIIGSDIQLPKFRDRWLDCWFDARLTLSVNWSWQQLCIIPWETKTTWEVNWQFPKRGHFLHFKSRTDGINKHRSKHSWQIPSRDAWIQTDMRKVHLVNSPWRLQTGILMRFCFANGELTKPHAPTSMGERGTAIGVWDASQVAAKVTRPAAPFNPDWTRTMYLTKFESDRRCCSVVLWWLKLNPNQFMVPVE